MADTEKEKQIKKEQEELLAALAGAAAHDAAAVKVTPKSEDTENEGKPEEPKQSAPTKSMAAKVGEGLKNVISSSEGTLWINFDGKAPAAEPGPIAPEAPKAPAAASPKEPEVKPKEPEPTPQQATVTKAQQATVSDAPKPQQATEIPAPLKATMAEIPEPNKIMDAVKRVAEAVAKMTTSPTSPGVKVVGSPSAKLPDDKPQPLTKAAGNVAKAVENMLAKPDAPRVKLSTPKEPTENRGNFAKAAADVTSQLQGLVGALKQPEAPKADQARQKMQDVAKMESDLVNEQVLLKAAKVAKEEKNDHQTPTPRGPRPGGR